jgi:pyrroloquinoline quinone biosynthesis protein E
MMPRPYTLVAELTYRCPLACPYCSNPTRFFETAGELSAVVWGRVFAEASALGMVQVHLTGGEPLLHEELEAVVAVARAEGLYVNLVTSGVPLDEERWKRLLAAGVDHVQLSFQAPTESLSDRIAGRRAFARKLDVARFVLESGTPLTLNVVLHVENIGTLDELLALALKLGAARIELAHAQYEGFALSNREALLPSAADVERARARVKRAREEYAGKLEIVHVLPDYHAGRPKACMDGWGRRYVVVTPDGVALPCHAARRLPGFEHENVTSRPLSWIWRESRIFNAYRGHDWMSEPCRSCERRFDDFGGCRCQAFALTGDAPATDPAGSLAPRHDLGLAARRAAADAGGERRRYLYRSPRDGFALAARRP